MSKYVFTRELFKCALCGAVFSESAYGGESSLEEAKQNLMDYRSEGDTPMHDCGNGRYGLSDKVGLEVITR